MHLRREDFLVLPAVVNIKTILFTMEVYIPFSFSVTKTFKHGLTRSYVILHWNPVFRNKCHHHSCYFIPETRYIFLPVENEKSLMPLFFSIF